MKKVLIVEDEGIVALDLKEQIKNLGYEVIDILHYGEHVLQSIKDIKPDLILMDVVLKGNLDGIETAKKIEEIHNIPIIFITAYSDNETIERIKQTSSYGYVLKPFDERELALNIHLSLAKKELEDKLKSQKNWYESILNSISDNVIVLDNKGLIIFTNPSVLELTGYSYNELMNKHLSQIICFNKDELNKFINEDIFQIYLLNQDRTSILKTKDNRNILIEYCTSYILNEFNEKIGLVFTFKDITQRKKVENIILKLNSLLSNLGIDFEENINLLTKTCGELLDANYVIYSRLYDNYLYVFSKWNLPIDINIIPKTCISYEVIKNIKKNNVVLINNIENSEYVESNKILIDYGIKSFLGFPIYSFDSPIGCVCCLYTKNITLEDIDCKVIEILAKTISNEEEKKLIQDKLKLSKEKAELASIAKNQFIANISHEIKTPMNAILGFLELLFQSNLDFKQREYIELALKSGEYLLRLINDLLDISKIEAKKLSLNYVSFNLKQEIEELIKTFKLNLKSNIKFTPILDSRSDINVYSDPVRLKQIVFNLLDNAQKFTIKGEIKLILNITDELEEYINIELIVKDTGIGIPIEKQKVIFEPFVQVDESMSREYGGSGLGLYIVKSLVELLGGSINLYSEPNQGSTFTIKLKLKKILQKNIEQNELELYDCNYFNQFKILVVEDNLINQKLMQNLLDKLGLKVDIATNCHETFEKIKNNSYDLCFMDLHLPLINGFELVKIIRQMGYTFPIIALSATDIKENYNKCIEVGMNDFIPKPININSLKSIINKWLVKREEVT